MKTKTFIFLIAALAFMVTNCKKPVEQTVKSSDGLEISYTVQGNGSPALVFIHGWSCDKTYWKNQVPEFSKNYKVITIDCGGHGKSGLNREKFTIESFGNDVVAVVNELKLEKMILIGHSMGGLVIMDAATKLPGKVVALVGVDTYEQLVDTVFAPAMMKQFIEPFYSDFVNSTKSFVKSMFPPGADSVLVETIAADMSSAPKDVAMQAFESTFEYNSRVGSIIQPLQLPVYAVNANLWPTDVEGNRKYAKSFDVKFMDGYGHFIMLENPEMFNRLLAETIEAIKLQK